MSKALLVGIGFLILDASDAAAPCRNALSWFGDDADPGVQRLWSASRVGPHDCFRPSPPDRCAALLALGERLIDYMLVQYEHARLSPSRIHQGESLIWLLNSLTYAEGRRSPTARRYLEDHRDEIARAPPDIRHEYWTHQMLPLLRRFGFAPTR